MMWLMPASHGVAQCRSMAYRLPLIALCLSTSAVLAQTVPGPGAATSEVGSAGGEVYRLSPAEIEATLDAAAARHASQLPVMPPLATTSPLLKDGRTHGEVGMMIGSGGARSFWGNTYVPLGQNGAAAFSFSTGRWPGQPY